MASPAWWLVAVACTLVVAVADRAETHELARGTLEEQGEHPSFRLVPGTPAGAVVYKSTKTRLQDECAETCDADEDCSAFRFDSDFHRCELLKTEVEKLNKVSSKMEKNLAKKVEKQAQSVAAGIVEKQEERKEEEKKAEAKIKSKPIRELEKKPSPRELWRQAVRQSALVKQQLAASAEYVKEAAERVSGTQTVERVVKRHVQETSEHLAARHKAFSAATLNMEEQIMIRDNPEAKEVVLARGAKEAAEEKWEKAHRKVAEAKRAGEKAVKAASSSKKANLDAQQKQIQLKLASEKSGKHLKEATKNYKAAEIKNKNDADLKKKLEAAKAKTYLKMRSQQQERDARAKEIAAVDFKEEDKKAADNCEREQERVIAVEDKLKEQLKEEITARLRHTEKQDIKQMKADQQERTKEKIAADTAKLVQKAKDNVDLMLDEMMNKMSHEELLGEVLRSKVEKHSQVIQAKHKLDSAESATRAAIHKMDRIGADMKSVKKRQATATNQREKSEMAKKIKGLEKQMTKAKHAAEQGHLLEKKARKEVDDAKEEVAQAEQARKQEDKDKEVAKVKASLRSVLEKKEILEAKAQATMQAAEDHDTMQKVIAAKERRIREASQKKVEELLSEEWKKKKAELKLVDVDCKKPHKTELEKLQDNIEKLQKEKALMALKPTPPDPSDINPAVKEEIERNVRAVTEAEFEQKLSTTKKEMQQNMEDQIAREKAIMKDEKKKLEAKTDKMKEELIDAKANPLKPSN